MSQAAVAPSQGSSNKGQDKVPQRQVLHVGCGPFIQSKLHSVFRTAGYREVRLDIDPSVAPDIVASMTDMSAVASASMDAIWSSHNVEHLFAHEVPQALSEFSRVLKPDGFAFITLPDLQAVAKLIADDKLLEPAYTAPAGPIAPLDMVYGFRGSIERGNYFMAHRTGFTARSLAGSLAQAGFKYVEVSRGQSFDLWALAFKAKPAPGAVHLVDPVIVFPGA